MALSVLSSQRTIRCLCSEFAPVNQRRLALYGIIEMQSSWRSRGLRGFAIFNNCLSLSVPRPAHSNYSSICKQICVSFPLYSGMLPEDGASFSI